MNLLKKSLTQRMLTALAGLFLLFIFWKVGGVTGLYIISALASSLLAYEVAGLLSAQFIKLLPFPILWFASMYFHKDLKWLIPVTLSTLIFWLLQKRLFPSKSKINFYEEHTKLYAFLTYALILPSFTLYHLLTPQKLIPFLSLLFSVFIFDTCSYFSGKALGKKIFPFLLFPQASPSKTLEGALGGLILATTILYFGSLKFPETFNLFVPLLRDFKFVFFAIFYFSVSLAGDLTESLFKRAQNQKDSGRLLPGHGGFFDRLDGVLLASLISYLLLDL